MTTSKTSLTLLESVKAGSSEAWERLDAIYRPFLRKWFRHRSIPDDVADDLTQQVLLIFARALANFEHSGRTGAFRNWLRRTAIFEEKAFWRKRSTREDSVGGTEFHAVLEELEDQDNALARYWDQQHDRFVLQRLLEEISSEFEPKSLTAFQRFAIDGETVETVATELSMSAGAIYVAKSRILRRLRAEAKELIDHDDW